MGQYYKAVRIDNDGNQKTFSPNNAIYMTKFGAEGIYNKSEEFWDMMSGLKLMEHSWLENDFVNGVLESVWDSPARLAWVGDYSGEQEDFNERFTPQTYESTWGGGAWGEASEECGFDEMPTVHKNGYILNLDKGVYIDLEKYASVAGFKPKWSDQTWTIHPLPLLTCIGNGRGGGDYWGACMDMVGAWTMDRIVFTEEWPSAFKEIDYDTIKFAEE